MVIRALRIMPLAFCVASIVKRLSRAMGKRPVLIAKSHMATVKRSNTVCTGQERVTTPEAALSAPTHSSAQEG
jgi:hypothetical protein